MLVTHRLAVILAVAAYPAFAQNQEAAELQRRVRDLEQKVQSLERSLEQPRGGPVPTRQMVAEIGEQLCAGCSRVERRRDPHVYKLG